MHILYFDIRLDKSVSYKLQPSSVWAEVYVAGCLYSP